MTSVTIENFEAKLASLMDSVKDREHRREILEYIHERRANGIRVSTLNANASVLRTFANFLGKPFDQAERSDLNAYVNKRTGQRVYRSFDRSGSCTEVHRTVVKGDATMDHHKVVLRGFYKWRSGGEDYPDCVKHLKTRTARKKNLGTSRLVSREELARLLHATDEPRIKALIAFMFETGLRAGELVALNVGSVAFDDVGAKVTIPGNAPGLKTGPRTVRILPNESAPFVHTWLELHALKDDLEAPLFYGASRRNPRGRMLPSSLYSLVKSLVRRAGIRKHIKPHDFRHTAATEKAGLGYNEAQLRWFFGWSRTSDMPSHYVHLAGADFERMMMERHGIEVPEERPRQVMHAACPTCSHTNPTINNWCEQCRRPLKPQLDPVESENGALLQVVRDMVGDAMKELQERL